MRYAETLLSEGEVVVLRSRQHWLALFLEARTAVALWLVAAALMFAVVFFRIEREGRDVISIIAIVALIAGVVLFLYRLWVWWAQDYLVTNRRLLKVEGIINKRSADSSLEKINDAVLEQDLVGRILNYGDLDILTAADTAIDRYRMLDRAKEFKREMLNQKHALEMEFAYRQPPSPALRADRPNMNGEPAGPYAVATAGAAPMSATAASAAEPGPLESGTSAPGPTGDEDPAIRAAATADPAASAPPTSGGGADGDASRDITQTLARLADLRDRGAITPEDYEAKKDELLSRL